jgi:hypothetical protein
MVLSVLCIARQKDIRKKDSNMPSGIFKDLTGLRYHRLVVIKRHPNINGKVMWECVCDCGTETIVRGDAFTQKASNHTRSCGCLQKEKAAENGKKGYLGFNVYLKNCVLLNYKQRADKHGIEFKLSREEFMSFLDKSCAYCGNKNTNTMKNRRNKEVLKYNGIDRIDSNKGYSLDNTVSCCNVCNYAKSDMGKQEFLSWLKRAYEYNYGEFDV